MISTNESRAIEAEHLVRQILARYATAPSEELLLWANKVILIAGDYLPVARQCELETLIYERRHDPVLKERAAHHAAHMAEAFDALGERYAGNTAGGESGADPQSVSRPSGRD